MRKFAGFLVAAAVVLGSTQHVSAEPGWSPVIIATGAYRQQIESTPIEFRPYRPLHFYGNAVRRNYYRGNAAPIPRFSGPEILPPMTSGTPIRTYRGF
ncbi:hypothetical protein [Rubripirellula reticaptiva]|uniref:Uncharacterized protein n=1 Tax=Rubripirellula reticaptiva TaxID=2528013 RepID=A0A5C6EQD2_9BACT|nr:hypothetical protein [Rubripirellula reticaptiva]TWU49599.1 hypothetical protein Poly59_42160 [Rubripirellula reticaptiva]